MHGETEGGQECAGLRGLDSTNGPPDPVIPAHSNICNELTQEMSH